MAMFRLWQTWKTIGWQKLARFYLWLATVEAGLRLRGQPFVRVLLDNSAYWKGVTHESAWVSSGEQMWGGTIPIDTGYSARIPVHSSQNSGEEYSEIKYLVAVAELARRRKIALATSVELKNEARRHPPGVASGYTYGALNAFSGVEIEVIEGPRFKIFETAEEQSKRLRECDIQPFSSLLPFFSSKDTLDVWHIHTAHVEGINFFLTMDLKFCRKFEQAAKRPKFPKINSHPVSPSELGKHFALRPVPTNLISYLDEDRTFFIRADLNLPGEARPTRWRNRQDRS